MEATFRVEKVKQEDGESKDVLYVRIAGNHDPTIVVDRPATEADTKTYAQAFEAFKHPPPAPPACPTCKQPAPGLKVEITAPTAMTTPPPAIVPPTSA